MTGQTNATLPKGSTILITGVNGFIASNCADQALHHGFRVRGTTRSVEEHRWMVELFSAKYGEDVFDLVEVKDMQIPGAFDSAMHGCSVVMHTASIMVLDVDPEKVVAPVIATTQQILQSAARTATVRRVVYTSSHGAVRSPGDISHLNVTQATWNDEAVRRAYSSDASMKDALAMYCASKTLAEKACFKFVEQQKPDFALTTILPNFVCGPTLSPTQPASTSGLIKAAFLGNEKAQSMIKMVGPTHYVDVRDCAKLHLAGAMFEDLANERVFGMAGAFNINDVFEVFGAIDERWKSTQKIDCGRDQSVYDQARSLELLRRLGSTEWVTFQQSIKANVAQNSSSIANILG